MLFFRRASLLLFCSALPVFAAGANTTPSPAPAVVGDALLSGKTYIPPAMPLARIAVYSLEPTASSGDVALQGLGFEIDRLYTHAKTLASGPERRALETRIYLLEKRLRPLAQVFDSVVWTQLRADVHAEWVSVQATLPLVVAANG